MPLEFQEIVVVKLSDEERVSQQISEESMGLAVSALHRDGVVVLENAVDLEHVDKLNSILSAEAEILASRYPITTCPYKLHTSVVSINLRSDHRCVTV